MRSNHSVHGPWKRWVVQLSSAAAAALLALAVTLGMSFWLSSKEVARAREDLQETGHSLVAALEVALAEINGQADAIASLASVVGELDVERFEAYADSLGSLAGTLGVGYAVQVPRGGLSAFQAWAQETDPSFEVFAVDDQGRPVPASDTHTHLVVLHFASGQPGVNLKGMCVSSDHVQASTLDALPLTDDLLLSPLLRLPGEKDDDGVVAFRRVPPDGETKAAVIVPIDLGQVLAARGFGGRWLWQVTDLGNGQVIQSATPPPGTLSFVDTIYVGHRVWQIEVARAGRLAPTPRLFQQWEVLLVGGLGSLITAAAVWLIVAWWREREEERRLHRSIAARDRFLASVSHELRTPLTAVIGFLETLPDADSLSPEQQEHVGVALEQSWELRRIIEDLLAATRTDGELLKATPAVVDLHEEAVGLLASVPREARGGIGEVRGGAYAWANPARVRQILRNLLDNAAKHGNPPIELSITPGTDGRAHIEVADHGPGLSAEQIPSLFAPYRTMSGPVGRPDNIGLGLWLSRRLARLMGGDISYTRRDGLTIFELTLPTAPQPVPSASASDSTRPGPQPATPACRQLSSIGSAPPA